MENNNINIITDEDKVQKHHNVTDPIKSCFKMSKSTFNDINETNLTNNVSIDNSANYLSEKINSKSVELNDPIMSKRNKRQTPATSLKNGTKVSFLSYNQEIENSEILLNYAFDSPRTFKSIKGRKQTPVSKHIIDDIDNEVSELNESAENSDSKNNSKRLNFDNDCKNNMITNVNLDNNLNLSKEVSDQIKLINENDKENVEENNDPIIDFRSLGRHSKKSYYSTNNNEPANVAINEHDLDERINTVLSIKSQTIDRKSLAKSRKSEISSSVISSFNGSNYNNINDYDGENENKDVIFNKQKKKKLKSILKKRISLPDQIEDIIIKASQQLHPINTSMEHQIIINNDNQINMHPIFSIGEKVATKDILELDSINNQYSSNTKKKIKINVKSESKSKSKSKSKRKSNNKT